MLPSKAWPRDVTLTRSSEPERILAQQVSADFFRVLAIPTQAGRTFSTDEVQPGRDSVVVLSHAFWKSRLASAPTAQRTHEIGSRMALGAGRDSVLRLSLSQSGRLAGIGLAIGLTAAVVLTRVMSTLLFNIIDLDWETFAGATLLLATCAFLAGYLPALRASRVDPMAALRHD